MKWKDLKLQEIGKGDNYQRKSVPSVQREGDAGQCPLAFLR